MAGIARMISLRQILVARAQQRVLARIDLTRYAVILVYDGKAPQPWPVPAKRLRSLYPHKRLLTIVGSDTYTGGFPEGYSNLLFYPMAVRSWLGWSCALQRHERRASLDHLVKNLHEHTGAEIIPSLTALDLLWQRHVAPPRQVC